MIALMLKNTPPQEQPGVRPAFRTLIVCPNSLMVQWKTEVAAFSRVGLKIGKGFFFYLFPG